MKLAHFTFLAFLLFSGFAFGQGVTIRARFVNQAGECDTQQKLLIIKQSGSDSTVLSFNDSLCFFEAGIPPIHGNYLLLVKTAEGNWVETTFTVGEEYIIELGDISLAPKTTDLGEVTFTGVPKKFIVHDADKTIVTVEGNPVLEVSSVYDAILKIPGILPFPGGGFAMSGQLASVYFEGIPSTISGTDLDNLLKSLPATSVQKIELISNPGASYDATTSGAIIDIISLGRVTKWISGTATFNSGFNRNSKILPSLLLSGKGKKYTWQFQTGYSYFERDYKSTFSRKYNYFDTLTSLESERREFTYDQNFYFRPSFTYRFNKNSFLQVNLGFALFDNDAEGTATNEFEDQQLLTSYLREGKGWQTNATVKYRVFLDTLKRKFEITSNFNSYNYITDRLTVQDFGSRTYSLQKNDAVQNYSFVRMDFELPFPKWKSQLNLGAKYTYYDALSSGKYNFNDTTELTITSTDYESTLPFRYLEQNIAFYTEWKQRIGKKIFVTAGLRMEDFALNGKLDGTSIVRRDYLNFFPSIHTLYRIADPIVFTANYSRKINMPSASQFDPNLTGYYDNLTTSTGNSALSPNFSHRMGAELTIFDYLEVSANYSLSNSINLSEATADSNSFAINQTYRTYNNVGTLSYFFALPVPFGMFKSGLDFFNQNIDVDAISFMYIYADRNKTTIPGYNYTNGNNPWWTFGFYSQFMLPLKMRLNVEYNYTAKGMYLLNETTKGIHDLELVLSRKFKDDKWRVSLTVQDLLNTNATYSRTSYLPLTMDTYSKADTRSVWFKVAYSFGRYERPALEEESIPSKGGGN